MSVFHENMLIGASGQAPAATGISRSIRLNAPDSAYLSRTPASAGNRKTWTWAGWVKRSGLQASGEHALFIVGTSLAEGTYFQVSFTNDKFSCGTGSAELRRTTAVYRDVSAWYHVMVAVDTTQATASNRVKMYVNGEEIAVFDTNAAPTLNLDTAVNSTLSHNIGRNTFNSSNFFSGYLADIHFIDGQALTPTSFGEFDATTGVWVPKAYTGSYTGNSFQLKFEDNSSNTATTLGKDTSGLGNNWTPNNLSVTAGAGNDSLVDVPTSSGTDSGLGGEVRGNYCTLNPLDSARTLSNGNLEYAGVTSGIAKGTIGVSSGKWYWECQRQGAANSIFGIARIDASPTTSYLGGSATTYGYSSAALRYNNGASASYGATYTSSDVVGVALDLDAGTLVFYKNGVSQGTAYSSLNGTFVPACGNNSTTDSGIVNFGQRPFAYPLSGFKALCSSNLPAPLITKPNTVMDVLLWTGNGSARSITGLGFNPDLVWIKSRSAATDHELTDSVRGTTKSLSSNLTAAEATDTGGLTAFNSDGFSLGTDTKYNNNTATYAGWCWDAGSSTVTNTQGSITSSVRANATAGFSVVTYTGTGTTGTVGHGLGVAPSLIIAKSRSASRDWAVYHKDLTKDKYLNLNATAGASTTTGAWGAAEPTSSVFGVYAWSTAQNNASGENMVAYCFAPVVGYSNGFSYTGNGSTDGSFVYLGFRPRLILLKCSSTTGNWTLVDTAREGYNVDNDPLYPNLSNAEGTTDLLDITSNGFKLRTTDASVNSNAATYIGFAWAESPFNYSRAR